MEVVPQPERHAEEALTHRRVEEKYLVAPAIAATLADSLAAKLPIREFEGARETWVTSLYLDRPDGSLAKLALASPTACLKLRAKFYFDGPTASAGGPAKAVLELKRRRRETSLKARTWVDRRWIEALCAPGPLALPRELRLLKPLRAPGPLAPAACVTYRRTVLQAGPELRVTIDRDVRFHPVSEALSLAVTPLALDTLPPATQELGSVVVEVKRAGPLPAWLSGAFEGLVRDPAFSKFVAAITGHAPAGRVA